MVLILAGIQQGSCACPLDAGLVRYETRSTERHDRWLADSISFLVFNCDAASKFRTTSMAPVSQRYRARKQQNTCSFFPRLIQINIFINTGSNSIYSSGEDPIMIAYYNRFSTVCALLVTESNKQIGEALLLSPILAKCRQSGDESTAIL